MMKKSLLRLCRALLFLAGFLTALWSFLPWREVGAASLTTAASVLEKRGMRLEFQDVEPAGQGFTANGLALGGFVNVAFKSLTLRPQLWASLLSLAPVCEVAFTGGAVTMGQAMDLGDGGFLLTAGRQEILLEQMHTNGDFALRGFMSIDPDRMKIGRAEAALAIPESFEQNMETLKGFLPLVREGDNWFLRRAGAGGGAEK